MTMKIPINRLKTCPINSEIYRDSDVGDLVNSIGEVGLLQQSRWCKTSRQCWRFVCSFFNNKFIFTTLQVKSPPSTPSSPVSNPHYFFTVRHPPSKIPHIVKFTSTPKENLLYLNTSLRLSHSISHTLQRNDYENPHQSTQNLPNQLWNLQR